MVGSARPGSTILLHTAVRVPLFHMPVKKCLKHRGLRFPRSARLPRTPAACQREMQRQVAPSKTLLKTHKAQKVTQDEGGPRALQRTAAPDSSRRPPPVPLPFLPPPPRIYKSNKRLEGFSTPRLFAFASERPCSSACHRITSCKSASFNPLTMTFWTIPSSAPDTTSRTCPS